MWGGLLARGAFEGALATRLLKAHKRPIERRLTTRLTTGAQISSAPHGVSNLAQGYPANSSAGLSQPLFLGIFGIGRLVMDLVQSSGVMGEFRLAGGEFVEG